MSMHGVRNAFLVCFGFRGIHDPRVGRSARIACSNSNYGRFGAFPACHAVPVGRPGIHLLPVQPRKARALCRPPHA